MQARVVDSVSAQAQAIGLIAAQARREAYVMAYADAFWIIAVGLIISLGAIPLLRRPQRTAPVEPH